MISRFAAKVIVVPVLVLLLLGGNFLHLSFSGSFSEMTGAQCQGACTNQQMPVNAAKPQDILKDKDIDPEPQAPYYLTFIGVGWVTTVLIGAAFLLRYLKWRPPDLYSLYGVYRF